MTGRAIPAFCTAGAFGLLACLSATQEAVAEPLRGLGIGSRAHRSLLTPQPVRPYPVRPYMKIPRTPYPEALYPQSAPLFSPGFTMTRIWTAQAAAPGADGNTPPPPLDKPRQVSDRLLACWKPPAMPVQQEVTVRLGFSRDGRVIGEPRVTYVGGALNEAHRASLRSSILKAIADCSPLRFTPALASAIAGRPFAIRFIAPAQKPSGNSI